MLLGHHATALPQAAVSRNTWEVVKDNLFKYRETTVKMFMWYVIQCILFLACLSSQRVFF